MYEKINAYGTNVVAELGKTWDKNAEFIREKFDEHYVATVLYSALSSFVGNVTRGLDDDDFLKFHLASRKVRSHHRGERQNDETADI